MGDKLYIPHYVFNNNASMAPTGISIGQNQFYVDAIFNRPESIALLTGISAEDVYKYNSWLIRGADIPEGTILNLSPASNSFNFFNNPNLSTEQNSAEDPTSSISIDNSTLFNNGVYKITGYGNVNTVTGIGSYANSILSDSYRPGANELLSQRTLAGGDFSYANISSIADGTGAYTNMLSSGAAKWIPVDPLVLDLNRDGVKLTSFGDSPVLFDVDNDGKKEITGWTTATDGIVVMDRNNNGVIDGIDETMSEYFTGTVGSNGNSGTKPYANGFAALKSLDSNSDGQFTSSDAAWNSVKVWVDANHNGQTDSLELKTFSQLGITSINLASTMQSGLVNGGNEILATGTFVQDGVTREAQAARFIANPVGNASTVSGSGTIVSAEDGQSTYVSGITIGERIDVASKKVLNAYGNSGNDALIGDANANWLAGSLGSDTFNAGAGDDMLIVDASDLQENIKAGDGFDMLQVVGTEGVTLNLAQAEVEVAVGGSGNDVLDAVQYTIEVGYIFNAPYGRWVV